MNLKNKKPRYIISIIPYIALFLAVLSGAFDITIPDSRSVLKTIDVALTDNADSTVIETEATATLIGLPVKNIKVDVIPDIKLLPCGDLFGVKFFTEGVMVVGLSDVESDLGIYNPASEAGINTGDVLISMDGRRVNTVEDVSEIIRTCGGKDISVEYRRASDVYNTTFKPVKSLSDGNYKSGLWVRDSTAGIGTVTFYNPLNGQFGGLGHGICDVDTGLLMPMLRGSIVDIYASDIIKGTNGTPGEIKGEFGIIKKGELYTNTEKGVYGYLDNKPLCAFDKPLGIALKDDVKEGDAYLYCSLGDNKINEYKIEIVKIFHNDSNTKNFIFNVKDKKLLERSGGIIQGMSGSPIIQDGKIIGAVTHVLINNPQKGYGIFIENMLTEAEKIK